MAIIAKPRVTISPGDLDLILAALRYTGTDLMRKRVKNSFYTGAECLRIADRIAGDAGLPSTEQMVGGDHDRVMRMMLERRN